MAVIKVNGIDISDRVTSIEVYQELSADKLIGSIASSQLKIGVRNNDGLLKDLISYPFIIDDNTFYVYECPEKWTQNISLTLYDKIFKTNVNYNSSLTNPTVSMQLDEISSITGINIDKSSLNANLLNREVSWYDSTETIRTHLGWIAECDGKNGFIINDTLVFQKLASKSHTIDFCNDYEINGLITISKIVLNDGVRCMEVGSDEGNKIFINASNPYITQDDIDYIYELYNGLSFYSFKKFKTYEINELILTDVVIYDDMFILPLSCKLTYTGGNAKNSIELTGDISLKESEGIVVDQSTDKKIKRIQTILDQNSNSLTIISQDVDGMKNDVSSLIVETNNLHFSVESLDSKMEQKISAEEIEIRLKQVKDEGAASIVTSKGFSFNDEGFSITSTDSDMSTSIDETGLRITSSNDNYEVLTATHEGVNATRLSARDYLFIGSSSRIEDYTKDNELRTAIFWLG